MDTDSTNDQGNDVPDQDAEPTMTAPGEDRPDGTQDSLKPDPGPAKNHGDPITEIDDEIRSGGGGND
jgi:hypothetical protein